MNCKDALDFYIKDTKYRMEQNYYQATGKNLEWGSRDEYMRRMYNIQNLGEDFLRLEHDLQMYLEIKNRIRESKV